MFAATGEQGPLTKDLNGQISTGHTGTDQVSVLRPGHGLHHTCESTSNGVNAELFFGLNLQRHSEFPQRSPGTAYA